MALETLTNKTIKQGNGATTVWPYAFIIPTTDTAVITFTDTDGTQTVLSTAQYTITGIDDANGGNVTYPLTGSPMSVGQSLTIERVVPYTQPTVLTNQGGFYPDVVEGADDWIVMQTQQLAERVTASIQVPSVDPAANAIMTLPAWQARANTYLFFDSLGNAGVAAGVSSQAISAAMLPVVQAATLLAGRIAFGIDSTAQTFALSGVAGTNTITANASAVLTALAAQQMFLMTPAATNTGAATMAITGASAFAAKNIFSSGAALIGGELKLGVPALLEYDGTQLNLLNPELASGSFTGTLTGCTTSPTQTIDFIKNGNVVTLYPRGDFTGTSNTTAKTITGMPTAIRPARLQQFTGIATDNGGTPAATYVTIATSGVISAQPNLGTSSWTNSGTATIFAISLTYMLI